MLMELSKQGSVYKLMKVEKKFSETRTARLMWHVLTALENLHSQDPPVLHRDLKPENLLMFENEIVKLTDFGWSAEFNDVRNTFCGTQEYLSPEMIEGTGHDEKLDIWTLGILIYEMIHAKTPFYQSGKGIDVRTQRQMIENNILKGNFKLDENLSKETKRAILSMLHPNKDKRPTAKELMNFDFFKNINNPLKKTDSMKMIDEVVSVKVVEELKVKLAEFEQLNENLMNEKMNLIEKLKEKDNSDMIEKTVEENNKLKLEIEKLKQENQNLEDDLSYSERDNNLINSKLNKLKIDQEKSKQAMSQMKTMNQHMFKNSKVNSNLVIN